MAAEKGLVIDRDSDIFSKYGNITNLSKYSSLLNDHFYKNLLSQFEEAKQTDYINNENIIVQLIQELYPQDRNSLILSPVYFYGRIIQKLFQEDGVFSRIKDIEYPATGEEFEDPIYITVVMYLRLWFLLNQLNFRKKIGIGVVYSEYTNPKPTTPYTIFNIDTLQKLTRLINYCILNLLYMIPFYIEAISEQIEVIV